MKPEARFFRGKTRAALITAVALLLAGCGFLSRTGSAPFEPALIPRAATAMPEAAARPVCPGGDCANMCTDRLGAFLQSSGKPASLPRSATRIGGPDKSILLTIYQVTGDQISSPVYEPQVPPVYLPYQSDTAAHQRIWNYFAAIIPSPYRQELTEFVIFTDGKGGIQADVAQDVDHPGHWALRVDLLDANDPRDLTYTLLHEFGHLLTLNDTQVTPDAAVMANPGDAQLFQQDSSACSQFFATNGCSDPRSYINLFFQEFWTKIYPQWAKINSEKDQRNYLALLGQFYLNYRPEFVSDYAATSPEEDIAETWAKFIFSKKPTGDDIASQKILFFYNYPELVDLRTNIVNGICNFSGTK